MFIYWIVGTGRCLSFFCFSNIFCLPSPPFYPFTSSGMQPLSILPLSQFSRMASLTKLLLLKPWWTGYKVDQKYSACVQILGESVKAKANLNNCFQS